AGIRLCEATILDVSPSSVGCTGVAYSSGYNLRCASIARRTSSSSVGGMVLIQVIRMSFLSQSCQVTACGGRASNKPGDPLLLHPRPGMPARDYCFPAGPAIEQSKTGIRVVLRDNRA